jgi:uncharacterized membrane protein YdjX (TVP38/TMEM64 family)
MSTTTKRLLFLILILLIIGIINHYLKIGLEGIRAFLEGFSPWMAVFIYALIYVLSTIFLPPTKDMFKLIGAICLGAILSSLGIWIAEIINAILLFYLARYLGRGFVKVRLRGRAKIIDERIGSSGFRGILILRLVPIIPYRVLDLLAGLSSVSLYNTL